jgi:hypothetical protein
VEWLPYEFTGVRSPAEVEHDLLVIARAGDVLNEAHVSVDRDDDDLVELQVSGPGGLPRG